MATIREYVQEEINSLGLNAGNVKLQVQLDKQQINDLDSCDTPEAEAKAKRVLIELIPGLLLAPDVTEGGMSIKRDKAAIAKYYGLLCSELGIVNRLDPPAAAPTVSDRSYLW